MLVAATQASASGDRRRDLISGWTLKALTTASTHNMVKTLAIIAAELYLSTRPANLVCNAMLLMDSTMSEKAKKLPIDQGLFLGFRQALARYTREKSCPAYMGAVIVNLSNFSHLLQASILPESPQPTLHFSLQLGLLSSGSDAMDGGQQASPPASRILKNYVCNLAGQGMLFAYLKKTMTDRTDQHDSSIEKFITLLISKAHLDAPSTQSNSLENDINQVYLKRDLMAAHYPTMQLRQSAISEPFIAMKRKPAEQPIKRRALFPEADYIKTKFTHSTHN